MDLPANLLPTMRAVLARLIPADGDPGALELGCEAFVLERMAEDPAVFELYLAGFEGLRGFEELSVAEQDARLAAAPAPFVSSLAAHAMEAAYTHPLGLKMVGFEVTG